MDKLTTRALQTQVEAAVRIVLSVSDHRTMAYETITEC